MKHLRPATLLLICLWASHLMAQNPEDALRAAAARFKALDSYSATVGFVMGDERDMGKVYYQGQKYHLDFPEDQTICDGTQIMNWNKGFGAINFPEPYVGPDLSAGGIYEVHKFPFKVEWADTFESVMRMRLMSQTEDLTPPMIMIGIGRKSGLIEEYTVYLQDGLTIETEILDYKLNPVLDPKLFMIDMDFVRRVENGEIPPVVHDHDH